MTRSRRSRRYRRHRNTVRQRSTVATPARRDRATARRSAVGSCGMRNPAAAFLVGPDAGDRVGPCDLARIAALSESGFERAPIVLLQPRLQGGSRRPNAGDRLRIADMCTNDRAGVAKASSNGIAIRAEPVSHIIDIEAEKIVEQEQGAWKRRQEFHRVNPPIIEVHHGQRLRSRG